MADKMLFHLTPALAKALQQIANARTDGNKSRLIRLWISEEYAQMFPRSWVIDDESEEVESEEAEGN
jgi:hypothetical protein